MVALAREAQGVVLILTHDHALDYELAGAALSGPASFIGMIGSATKRARFRRRLAGEGFDEAALDRLTCPIGLPGIVGKAPGGDRRGGGGATASGIGEGVIVIPIFFFRR